MLKAIVVESVHAGTKIYLKNHCRLAYFTGVQRFQMRSKFFSTTLKYMDQEELFWRGGGGPLFS